MKNITRKIKTFIMAMSLTLIISAPALAEDTEIFTNANANINGANANLTFIIDTSGSMRGDVVTTNYDPSVTYSGACPTDRVYWKRWGSIPGCSSNQYFAASANKCAASFSELGAGGTGFYVTRAARYRTSNFEDRWDSLNSNDHDDPVECRDDWAVHGESNASSPYPADENDGGPWRSNSTNAINWNRAGATYTLYSANYLNWRADPAATTTTLTRLEVVQTVFSDLMDSISNINVAVMRFDNTSQDQNHGGYFIMPMEELTDANRESYKTEVNGLTAAGYTPLSESLYESYLFYRGDAVEFGDDTTPGQNVPGVLDGVSSPGNSGTSPTHYKSPIEYQCQKNFVILLTDGEPTNDTDADGFIQTLPGFSAATGAASCTGNCLDELAEYMYTQDCSSLPDSQNVITFTIGFNTDQALLQSAATKGGGSYYTADNTADLADAFTNILTEILAINTSFIAPAVSVNAFNRFNHREELYYALFRPERRPKWHGNVKRFRLYSPDANTRPQIVDANSNLAVNPNTAFFKNSSRSFWTMAADAPDGDDVEKGGAASKLTLPRTIYTYTGESAPDDVSLSSSANALHESNTAITVAMLGDEGMTDVRRTTVLQWARGVDLADEDSDMASDDIRRQMGDFLHSKPVLVTYGGSDDDPDMTLFAGSNEGYLHAIDTTDGSELFSFVPQELLPNLSILLKDNSSADHPYGLDGPLTPWVNDVNDNGVIFTGSSTTPDADEHIYLYQGMRRGGNNYYALDMTYRSAPKLKWMIEGGVGDFAELGQSWSATTLARIKFNGADKIVLIFGGGYDTAQDSNATAQADSIGRAIFMVDAVTGEKIWEAGPGDSAGNPDLTLNEMTNSIPSDIAIIDTNSDGYKDRMYVGDMAGQVWRFDIDNENNSGAGNLVTGGVIAKLGDDTEAGNRRFYYAPDVSLGTGRGFINIAIGSGYRSHPLDTAIHDAFFVIRDENVFEPELGASGKPVYTAVTMGGSGLYDATANVAGEGSETEIDTASTAIADGGGFYINLSQMSGGFVGEKVLAKSLTFSGYTMFTTYTPIGDTSGSACSPSQGQARAYLIYVSNGAPVPDGDTPDGTDDTDTVTRIDREKDLVRGGIPPEPTIVFHEQGPVLLVGTENLGNPGAIRTPIKTNWKEK